MTFAQLVADLQDRLNLTSADSATRLGRQVNRYYRRIRTALGLQDATMRAVAVSAAKTLGAATVTFSGVQKLTRVYDDTSGTKRFLTEVEWDSLRDKNPGASNPTEWATQSADDDTVTILLNVLAQDTDVLKADGFLTTSDLSGSQVPAFPEDFHDILIEGVLADEYRKRERLDLAKISKAEYEARLSDLRMWFAKNLKKTTRQGELAGLYQSGTLSGSGGGSAPSGGTSYTQTGLITFDRDPSAPFAVTDGSASVDNLFVEGIGSIASDRLIGRDTAGTGESEQLTVGGGIEFTGSGGIRTTALTGDVTKAAGGTSTTIANDAVTTAKILNDNVTYAKIQNVTAASRLLGRGSASGAGDIEEITLGTGLSMSGTALSSSQAPGGSDTQIQFNDSSAFNGDAGLTYNKTTDALTLAGPLVISGAAAGQVVFPASQNASANANTLDDYEEGSWTVTPNVNLTLTGATGYYVKVGKLVHLQLNVTVDTVSGVDPVTFSLPFAAAAGVASAFIVAATADVNTGDVGLTARIVASASVMDFFQINDNAGRATLGNNDLAAADVISVSGTYIATA